MASNLSLSIDRPPSRSRPSELAAFVRRTLAENTGRLEKAITAGALTVSVSSEDNAIEIYDQHTGRVRFMIGGLPRITEIVPFVIDWKKRTLELRLSEMETDEASEQAAPASISPLPIKKLRIIHADDSPDMQEMFSKLLSDRGHSVKSCSDGQAAFREITEDSYDVLITDNNMPRMGGLDLVRALRNIRCNPKIIVTSAFLEPETEVEYRSLGVRRFLPKPSPSERILKAVEDD